MHERLGHHMPHRRRLMACVSKGGKSLLPTRRMKVDKNREEVLKKSLSVLLQLYRFNLGTICNKEGV